jgi:hypothetical protein
MGNKTNRTHCGLALALSDKFINWKIRQGRYLGPHNTVCDPLRQTAASVVPWLKYRARQSCQRVSGRQKAP